LFPLILTWTILIRVYHRNTRTSQSQTSNAMLANSTQSTVTRLQAPWMAPAHEFWLILVQERWWHWTSRNRRHIFGQCTSFDIHDTDVTLSRERMSKATTFIAFRRRLASRCTLALLIHLFNGVYCCYLPLCLSLPVFQFPAQAWCLLSALLNHIGLRKRTYSFLGVGLVTLQWLRRWFEARRRREFLQLHANKISVQEIAHSRISSNSWLCFHYGVSTLTSDNHTRERGHIWIWTVTSNCTKRMVAVGTLCSLPVHIHCYVLSALCGTPTLHFGRNVHCRSLVLKKV